MLSFVWSRWTNDLSFIFFKSQEQGSFIYLLQSRNHGFNCYLFKYMDPGHHILYLFKSLQPDFTFYLFNYQEPLNI